MRNKKVKSIWPLVAVHWRDAFDGENGWTEIEKYDPKEVTVVTVGYLWADCLRGYITIVNSYCPDEMPEPKTVGMPVHIPVGMVIDITVLEQPFALLEDFEESEDSEKHSASSLDYQPSQAIFHSVANPHPEHLQ
jgi:hypothetical protein